MFTEDILRPEQFQQFLAYLKDQRIGQAFFNVLDPEHRDTLRGSTADPFYKDTLESIILATDYLTKEN